MGVFRRRLPSTSAVAMLAEPYRSEGRQSGRPVVHVYSSAATALPGCEIGQKLRLREAERDLATAMRKPR